MLQWVSHALLHLNFASVSSSELTLSGTTEYATTEEVYDHLSINYVQQTMKGEHSATLDVVIVLDEDRNRRKGVQPCILMMP